MINLIVITLVFIGFCLLHKGNTKYVNHIVLLAIGIYAMNGLINSNNLMEGFSCDLNCEAIQNIASLYNKENMTIDNLTVTGNLDVQGKTTTKELGAEKGNLGWINFESDRLESEASGLLFHSGGYIQAIKPKTFDPLLGGIVVKKISGLDDGIHGNLKVHGNVSADNFKYGTTNIADSIRPKCDWTGWKWIYGDQGCADDVALYCSDGRITETKKSC